MAITLNFSLNTRIPIDFVETNYIEPVATFLKKNRLGKVTGQGQRWSRDFTAPDVADFDVKLHRFDARVVEEIIDILEQAGAPLGCSWHDINDPDKAHAFGTLDAVLLQVTDLETADHDLFESRLSTVIDRFHKAHADTSGFQGVSLNPKLVVVAFHGFDHGDMKAWLRDLVSEVELPGTCALETQVAEAA